MRLGRGFSLFELVVVLAITGVAAAIAAPRYGRAMGRYRTELAAQRVAEELRAASEAARIAGATVAVRIDTAAECVDSGYASGDLAGQRIVSLCLETAPYRADLHDTWTSGDAGVITFGADGRAETDGWVVVVSGDLFTTVSIAAGTYEPVIGATEVAALGVIKTPAKTEGTLPGTPKVGGVEFGEVEK